MREVYKDSVIGQVPIDWNVVKLGDIGIFTKGKGISKSEVADEGLPCIRYGEIYTTHNFVIKKFYSFISEDIAKDSKQIVKNDIIFAGSGETVEEIGKAVAFINDFVAYAGGDTIIFSPTKDHALFLSYLLNDKVVIKQRTKFGQGNSVVHIYSKDLSQIFIPLPPLPEQQKIATILTTIDDKIENIEAQISEYAQLKKGLMQRLLSQGIGHSEFKDSVLGRIPKEWEIKKLDDLTEKIIDGTHFTPDYKESGVPFLRITDIKNSIIDFSTIKYISQEEHELLCKRCKPQKGDILVSKNGTIGLTKIVDWDWEFSIFVSLALIRTKSNIIDNRFLTYIFSSGRLDDQIKNQIKQGTVINLHLEEIRKFRIPLPSLVEQVEIANLLSSSDDKLDLLNLQKEEYVKMKKGLMEQLLAGKLRVKV